MQLEELLLKELEYARVQHKACSDAEDKTVRLFGAIIIGLVVFVIKRDLPEKVYLLVLLEVPKDS